MPPGGQVKSLRSAAQRCRRDRILRGQAVVRMLSIGFGRQLIAATAIEKAKVAFAVDKGVRQIAW
jgi:hypothetical protein